jgi:hypothetical protein
VLAATVREWRTVKEERGSGRACWVRETSTGCSGCRGDRERGEGEADGVSVCMFRVGRDIVGC